MAEEKINATAIIVILIVLITLVAYLFVANNWFPSRSSLDDAEALFEMISGIAHKDFNQVSSNAQQGFTFLGMFIMIFLILFFTMQTSLKHIFNKKVSIFVAFIFTLYGFISNVIYAYMVNLSAYLVGILVFLSLIMVLWGGFKNMTE